MKREIKFRFFSKASKKMYSGKQLENIQIKELKSDEDWEVMQFTGLKDKKGKEIYEGDILQDTPSIRNVVEFDVEWGRWHAGNDKGFIFGHREVIGNIYENPELIK